jgi:hypothetical protein
MLPSKKILGSPWRGSDSQNNVGIDRWKGFANQRLIPLILNLAGIFSAYEKTMLGVSD